MKLSEAIRLGAMLKPQAFGPKSGDASCALNAAADALGLEHPKCDGFYGVPYSALWRMYPVLRIRAACPKCGTIGQRYNIIECLNDTHRVTREAIADIVEGWERQLEAEAPVKEAEVTA